MQRSQIEAPSYIPDETAKLLSLHERGTQRVTLERVDGVGITSYILTHARATATRTRANVRRTIRRVLLRRTVVVVPVVRQRTVWETVSCEVFTSHFQAFCQYERIARQIR